METGVRDIAFPIVSDVVTPIAGVTIGKVATPNAIDDLSLEETSYRQAVIEWTEPKALPRATRYIIQLNTGNGWLDYTTDVPDPVDDLQVSAIANKEVLVEFTAPDYNNEAITAYTYQYRAVGSEEWITVE